jgi:hypothetical protein
MPQLIQNITASLGDNFTTNIDMFKSVTWGVAKVECNYLKLGAFEGFLFDYRNTVSTEVIASIQNYGLISNNNAQFTELKISY